MVVPEKPAQHLLALAGKAEELGVEIFPGFAATEILYDGEGRVTGVATGDMGVGRDGRPKAGFQRGMALNAKYTLIAEGARGSLAKQLIQNFGSFAEVIGAPISTGVA